MDVEPSTSKWLALAVKQVDAWELFSSSSSQGTPKYPTLTDLPTIEITVRSKPRSSPDSPFARCWSRLDKLLDDGVAILSWRWDGPEETNPASRSRNIFLAIDYAKKHGIKYLLIDIVSIDQTLPDDAKMEQVTAFTQLYRTTRVLCAYNDTCRTLETMQRPWIWLEMSNMLSNTRGITFLQDQQPRVEYADWVERRVEHFNGHDQHTLHLTARDYYASSGIQIERHIFVLHLRRLGYDGFLPTICGLMVGDIKMHDLRDIRYILPALAPILSVAYEKMERNDYLMTVALLSEARADHTNPRSVGVDVDNMDKVYTLKFLRYSLRTEPPGPVDQYFSRSVYLDGSMIGILWKRGRLLNRTVSIQTFPDVVPQILSALGMSVLEGHQEYLKGWDEHQRNFARTISDRQAKNLRMMTMGEGP